LRRVGFEKDKQSDVGFELIKEKRKGRGKGRRGVHNDGS